MRRWWLASREHDVGASRVTPPECSRRTEWLVFGLVLVIIGAISISPVLTPAVGSDQHASVDAVRGHIEVIATEPHPMGTPEIERVRSYVIGALADMGLTAETQAVEAPDYLGIARGAPVEVVNVLARIPGSSSTGAVLLIAHYDTVPETAGANDNSMAVGNLLEVAREIQSGPQLANDVILLFSDGEEPNPRYGASAFLDHPWASDVAVALNFEAVGEFGPSLLVEELGGNGVSGAYAGAVDDPAAFSFMTQTAELIGGAATDFDVFRKAGVPGLVFATFRGSAIYHTADDSIDRVHDPEIAHQRATALSLAQALGDTDLTTIADGGFDIFFTVFPGTLIQHPPWWLAAVLASAAIGFIALVVLRWREGTVSTGGCLRDFGVSLGAAALAMIAGSLLWMLLVSLFPNMGVAASYVGLAAITVVIGAVAARVIGWRARLSGADSILVASLAIWVVVAGLVFLGAPRASYVFVWPALVGVMAALTMPWWTARWVWVGGSSIVALAALALTVPMIDTFFLIAGPRPGNPGSELPYVIAVSALGGFLAILLIGTTALAGAGRSAHVGCSCTPADHEGSEPL
ncbi:MAG: M28 family peptidase [Acidimicrobiia bacterium]